MSTTVVTTSVRFISQTLEDMYAGGSEVGSTFVLSALGSALASFRGDGTGQTQLQNIATVDATIQTFETAYVPNTSASGTTAQNYPVDQQGLTAQLLKQVFAQLIQDSNMVANSPIDPSTGFVNNTTLVDNFSQLDLNPNDFVSGEAAGKNAMDFLSGIGQQIYTMYYNLIQGAFAEGTATANNPMDPVTNQAASTAEVTAVPPQVINGVTYGYVTSFITSTATNPPTFASYLVPSDIVLQAVAKQAITSAQYAPAGTPGPSNAGYQVTFVDQTTALPETKMIPVNPTTFQPTGGAAVTMDNLRFMDAITYTYYWNEARVSVMKGQLNYQQDVVQILQNALSAANAASTDLTQQSGLTEQQDSSQKPDPNASPETTSLNMFVAIVSTPSNMLFSDNFANPSTGNTSTNPFNFNFNYSEWQANQVALKNYTDNLNAQAQNAMLDYQQTLNNYNNAYQVMGQIQDKFNTMFQSQLQNFLSTTS